jgi:hypothetical protein
LVTAMTRINDIELMTALNAVAAGTPMGGTDIA